jgi:hypothetical protein
MKRLSIAIFLIALILITYFTYSFFNINETNIPAPKIFSHNQDYWRGKYVFGYAFSETNITEPVEQYVVLMDYQGKFLASKNSTKHAFSNINQLSKNEIYYYLRPPRGSRDAIPEATIWNIETGTARTILEGIDIRGHHEFLIEDEYFVTMRRIEKNGLDTIVHLDPETGNETWFWSSEPLFTEKPCSLCRDDDWTHGNDVTISLDGNFYYVNFRNTDSFAKVDRETRKTVWVAGRGGNFRLFENGIEKESLWYHSHIIKEIEPNVFLMFDNDFHNLTHLDSYPGEGEDPFVVNYGGRSRLIKFTIDETTMSAEVTWNYQPPAEYFSAIFGDVDILPNGNIIGVFGTPVHKWNTDLEEISEPFGASLLEINGDGELLREYRFPLGVSIYRIQEWSDNPTEYSGSAWVLGLS